MSKIPSREEALCTDAFEHPPAECGACNGRSAIIGLALALVISGCAHRETAVVAGARDGVLHVKPIQTPSSGDPPSQPLTPIPA